MPFVEQQLFRAPVSKISVCFCLQNAIVQLYYPCACAARGRVIGLSVSLSVCPSGLSSEGLVEGLFQDRSVRIQKILAST